MIKRLKKSQINSIYDSFCKILENEPIFKGEIKKDLATRITLATDNSIYQKIPSVVIFPKSHTDIALCMAILQRPKFKDIKLTPRGGGTGTNGQSLNSGVILDTSKYMRKIIEVNQKEKWADVEPGITLDELNSSLSKSKLFFAPHVSPSSHATIGGMVNTDASGKGSGYYGKTSDNVESLTMILGSGEIITTDDKTTKKFKDKLIEITLPYKKDIKKYFKKSKRPLTGYNLGEFINTPNSPNLIKLFCGSEGTLGITTKIRIKLLELPKEKTLCIIGYKTFKDALNDAMLLNKLTPIAIETIDQTIVEAAKTKPDFLNLLNKVSKDKSISSYNFIEFNKIKKKIQKSKDRQAIHFIFDPIEIKQYWKIRKESVGLAAKQLSPLSKYPTKQAIPFIEDTVVPTENLAKYINELRKILDKYKLSYSMYGHADVGCIHVRPALNMLSKKDQNLIRPITNEVKTLVKKYKGLFWGEHSKGYRNEFSEEFFGKECMKAIKEIKYYCDPKNKLNPGKIISLEESYNLSIDSNLRGNYDAQLSKESQKSILTAIKCNGNGKCFDNSPESIMCPSNKITHDRIHSPKGRAAILREWHRLQDLKDTNNIIYKFIEKVLPIKQIRLLLNSLKFPTKGDDYNHEVYAAMKGCLHCKACVGQCPVNIEIPQYVSEFFYNYHTLYPRPLRDYLLKYFETLLPLMSNFPITSNYLTHNRISKQILSLLKLSPPPKLPKKSLKNLLKMQSNIKEVFIIKNQKELNYKIKNKDNNIFLVPDPFSYHYEPIIWLDCIELLQKLEKQVIIIDYFPTGKPLHVKGFLPEFKTLIKQNYERLSSILESKQTLTTLEPSIAYLFKDEYKKYTNSQFNIHIIQESIIQLINDKKRSLTNTTYYLLSHCTENTVGYDENRLWKSIFEALNLNLEICNVGCCGMAGNYGHEKEHESYSKGIFELSWKPLFDSVLDHSKILATGFSCREQIKKQLDIDTKHPIQILNSLL